MKEMDVLMDDDKSESISKIRQINKLIMNKICTNNANSTNNMSNQYKPTYIFNYSLL